MDGARLRRSDTAGAAAMSALLIFGAGFILGLVCGACSIIVLSAIVVGAEAGR